MGRRRRPGAKDPSRLGEGGPRSPKIGRLGQLRWYKAGRDPGRIRRARSGRTNGRCARCTCPMYVTGSGMTKKTRPAKCPESRPPSQCNMAMQCRTLRIGERGGTGRDCRSESKKKSGRAKRMGVGRSFCLVRLVLGLGWVHFSACSAQFAGLQRRGRPGRLGVSVCVGMRLRLRLQRRIVGEVGAEKAGCDWLLGET